MRNVLRNGSEVCHFWANRKQASGKSGSMFFENDTIYSYGHHFPIARHVNADTILFTTRDYSTTTAGHKSGARRAIPADKTVIYVRNIEDTARDTVTGNIDVMIIGINETLSKAATTKKHQLYVFVTHWMTSWLSGRKG